MNVIVCLFIYLCLTWRRNLSNSYVVTERIYFKNNNEYVNEKKKLGEEEDDGR